MLNLKRVFAVSLFASCVFANATTLDVPGIVRDFKMRGTEGGHPDFEWQITGHTPGMVKSTLNSVTKRPEYIGTNNYGGVTDASTFDQWYQDVSGVNQGRILTLTCDDALSGTPGVYRYQNFSFFPIDNEFFGNQGQSNNFAFTFAINRSFVYKHGQNFSFTGDDDVWVYIDNKLVIDLGGVHGSLGGSVNLDTLGLNENQSYDFDLYFAERHTSASSFSMDVPFVLVPEPSTWVALGLGALLVMRRKRK